jgi:hypothetical protein
MNNQTKVNTMPKLSISYLGRADDKVTHQLIGLSESFTHDNGTLKKLSKKISLLITESFQNVIRHGKDTTSEPYSPEESDFFQINIQNNQITISSSNFIDTDKTHLLESEINTINKMSSDELREMWKLQILNDNLASKGGAGLGIIEMARKSGLPLITKFIRFNEVISRFYLGIEINNPKEISPSKFDISNVIKDHKASINDGMSLSYKGNFSVKSNVYLTEMLQNNFLDENNIDSITIENVTIIIEVIQNISKHGAVIDNQTFGCFSVRKDNEIQYIETNNYVNTEDYSIFKLLLEEIKSKNKEELKTERKKKLLEHDIDSFGNGKLGLIEIGLFTNNEFEYNFEKTENDLYYFSLKLKLKHHD